MRRTRRGEIQDRFFDRVDKNGPNGCWLWTGAITKTAGGYGQIAGAIHGKRYAPKGQAILAHRASWILHFGEIPAHPSYHGLVVMHKCDNRLCVNPDHLMLGTQAQNNRDMGDKKRYRLPDLRSVQHPRAAFNEEQLSEILISPLSGQQLAYKFGVSRSTVNRVRAGTTYA